MDQQASLAWLVARFGLALVAREAVYNRFFTNWALNISKMVSRY